jgi:hypothetical protein
MDQRHFVICGPQVVCWWAAHGDYRQSLYRHKLFTSAVFWRGWSISGHFTGVLRSSGSLRK